MMVMMGRGVNGFSIEVSIHSTRRGDSRDALCVKCFSWQGLSLGGPSAVKNNAPALTKSVWGLAPWVIRNF